MKQHRKKSGLTALNHQNDDVFVLAGRALLDLFIVLLFYVMLRGPLGLP